MSFSDKFKDKKFVKILTAIGIGTVAVVCSLSVVLSSWFSYKAYYDQAYAEKEYQKYLNGLPLVFLGIEASKSDLVVYCNNGKASPKEEDFIVMANFTEKGKAFSKRLAANTYTVSYPDNFASRGGDVVITYTYQPEKAEDAAETDPMPDPITKSTTVPITLEDVAVTFLEVSKTPNRTYYKEGSSFDADGMELVAHYNDGRKSTVTGKDVDFNAASLTEGTQSVCVSYGAASADVPVTVVAASDYNDGEVVDIAIEGEVFVKENSTVDNTVKASVRGTYESGNRLLLPSDRYSLVGRGTPSFGRPYYVTASLVGAADVTSTYKAYVQKSYEAESATLSGATTTTVEGYAYTDGTYTSVGNVSAARVENGSSVTFTVTASDAMKTQFNVCFATQGESVPLNKIATMRVNGKKVGISASAVTGGLSDKTKPVFTDYILSNLCLVKGDNTISFTFDNIPAASTVLFDQIGLLAGGKGEAELQTGKYMLECATSGETPHLTLSKAFDWQEHIESFSRGLCTDGTYIYGVGVGFAGNWRLFFSRFDVANGTVEYSKTFYLSSAVTEETAGITYYDGKLIVFQENGGMKCIDANFDETTEISDFTGFDAFKKDGEIITNVYYNQTRQLFAVRSTGKLRVYDKNKEMTAEVALQYGVRMAGDDEYIYVSNNANVPWVEVFDWTGKKQGGFNIPNSAEVLAYDNFGQTNTQGIVFLGGDLYYTAIRWSDGTATALVKVSAADAFDKELDVIDYTTGETLASSTATDEDMELGRYLVNNDAASTETTQVTPWEAGAPNYGFIRGMCTDGVNIYYVCTEYDGGDGARIVRFNVATGEKTVSKAIMAGNATDGVKEKTGGITYYKGKLVIYAANGTAYCIDANFTDMTDFVPFTGFDAFKTNANEMITDVYYCAETQKYVVGICALDAVEWSAKTVRVFDRDMNKVKEFASPEPNTNARMTADSQYIYFNNRNVSPNITAYTWDGTRAGTFTLANSAEAMGVASTNDMNTQGIVSLNGSFYFAAITWSGDARSTIMKVSRTDISIPETPTAVERDRSFINVWDGNIGDACSDDEYIYTSVITETGVSVYKVDGDDMSIEAKSREIALANATAMLYIKDGELCVIAGGKTYAISLKDFEKDCVLTVKTTGVLSGSLLADASAVTYNADTDMFAVVSDSQNKVYLVKADGVTVEKTVDMQAVFQKAAAKFLFFGNENEATISSVACDEKYIYVTASCKGQEALPVILLNWDGDVLGTTQFVGGITISSANGNFDVGGTFIYQGKLLVIARSLAQGGGYVWEIKA